MATRGGLRLNGQCRYPDAIAQFQREAVLALCDSVTIDTEAEATTFDFRRGNTGSMRRFTGALSGQRMAVAQVWLRSGGLIDATGTCEIFPNAGKVSVVSCLARAGTKTFAANFVASRL